MRGALPAQTSQNCSHELAPLWFRSDENQELARPQEPRSHSDLSRLRNARSRGTEEARSRREFLTDPAQFPTAQLSDDVLGCCSHSLQINRTGRAGSSRIRTQRPRAPLHRRLNAPFLFIFALA